MGTTPLVSAPQGVCVDGAIELGGVRPVTAGPPVPYAGAGGA
jgi:hypothetical protein